MTLDVDALAQEIRRIDGSNKLGAGQLAEALMPFLSTAPSGQAPLEGVKALAWKDNYSAETPFGTYTVSENSDDRWEWTFHCYPYGSPDETTHNSSEAAKAAAQADYEARIRSALLPASAEPAVGWQHRIYYEDTGKWSDWRDGKRNTRFDNEFEERPVYAFPPASGAVEADTIERCTKVCLDEAAKVADTNADRYWQSKRIEGAIRSLLPTAPTREGQMSVVITNISEHDDLVGENDYVLRINHHEIARFKHTRSLGLADCLRRAAEAAERASLPQSSAPDNPAI